MSTASPVNILNSASFFRGRRHLSRSREMDHDSSCSRGRRRAGCRDAVSPAVSSRIARRALQHGVCSVGSAALQLLSDAGDARIILILSDINMPEMSGLEFLPKAKAARPDVPVIMITAYSYPETKREALENGAEALLNRQSHSTGSIIVALSATRLARVLQATFKPAACIGIRQIGRRRNRRCSAISCGSRCSKTNDVLPFQKKMSNRMLTPRGSREKTAADKVFSAGTGSDAVACRRQHHSSHLG
jgi:CheY-like chemotaxis protein